MPLALVAMGNKRWATDVLAGAAIGFLFAETVWHLSPALTRMLPPHLAHQLLLVSTYVPGAGAGGGADVPAVAAGASVGSVVPGRGCPWPAAENYCPNRTAAGAEAVRVAVTHQAARLAVLLARNSR